MDRNDYFEYSLRTRVVSGPGGLSSLSEEMDRLGIIRPMVVTDQGVAGAGLLDKVVAVCPSPPVVFSHVPPDSDRNVVNRVAELFREEKCDGFIALGGGSVLDTAKGINLVVSLNADDLTDYAGAGAIDAPLMPLITLPTTAGTGSEVTLVAVIADHETKRKMLFTSNYLQPDTAILDPVLTLTLPPHITAASAMDALCHACEAFYGLGKNPFSDAVAREAVNLIMDNLVDVVEHPDNSAGRLALAQGALLAGAAFSNSMVGMAHSIGHSLGAVCGIPHATAMAVLLPYAMEYNFPEAEERIADLAEILVGGELEGLGNRAKTRKGVEILRSLNALLRELTGGRHPENLEQICSREGVPLLLRDQFDEVARTTQGDGSIIYNNRELAYEEILEVLEAAYSGKSLWEKL